MLAETHVPDQRVEQGLEAGSADLFKAAFQSTQMALLMVDPRQAGAPVVFANEAFCRLTGYSQDEVIGCNSQLLHGPDTDHADAAAIEAALRSGANAEAEVLSYRKDGTPFWNALVVSPVHDEEGHPRYFIMFHSDVSAKKKAEFELMKTKRDLEEQVALRTRDLQAALEQKTVLLHEVEHRVKNSLQMIASLVLLKARRIQNLEARKRLQELAERVSALSTAHRLLYTAGDVSRFDLGDFASELTGELAAALPPGQVDLNLDIQPLGVPAAKAASLALLLNELIGNAVKHAFPDGRRGHLTIHVGRSEQGLTIAVEDDGVGLHHSPPPEGSFGKTLITMLVQQLKGQLTWRDMEPGTRAEIVMPVDAQEARLDYR
jgi:PAS domain S-box-containing protein